MNGALCTVNVDGGDLWEFFIEEFFLLDFLLDHVHFEVGVFGGL